MDESPLDAVPAGSNAMWLRWQVNSTTPDGFRVERSPDGGTSWTSVATVPNVSRDYFDFTGLTSEQRVCYRVIAYNVTGDAAPSNTDCATPPRAPSNFVATVRADGAVDVTWNDNSGVEDAYEVVFEFGSLDCGSGSCSISKHRPRISRRIKYWRRF